MGLFFSYFDLVQYTVSMLFTVFDYCVFDGGPKGRLSLD